MAGQGNRRQQWLLPTALRIWRPALLLFVFGLPSVTLTSGWGPVKAGTSNVDMLKLRGQVVDVHLVEEDRNQIRFAVKLKLDIFNSGNEPAIVLKQTFNIGAEMLAQSYERAAAAEYVYKSAHWPSVSRAREWTYWREKLNAATPSHDQVSVLLPGKSLSFEASSALNIEKAGSFDRTSKTWDEIKQVLPLVIQIEIKLWPANLEPDHNPEKPEFGEQLRLRWQSYGELQLGHLTSEPMPLSFPTSR